MVLHRTVQSNVLQSCVLLGEGASRNVGLRTLHNRHHWRIPYGFFFVWVPFFVLEAILLVGTHRHVWYECVVAQCGS